jgi:hypothetical protein
MYVYIYTYMFGGRRNAHSIVGADFEQRFRGGLVFKAHSLCVSHISRLERNAEEEKEKRTQHCGRGS